MRRGGSWGATFFMLCVVLTLLQLLIVGVLALRGASELLTAKSGIHVEVLRSATDQDIQRLYEALKALPYAEEVTYVPQEKALERAQAENPALVESLQAFSIANPFPDSFSVVLSSLDSYEQLMAFMQEPAWRNVVEPAGLAAVAGQESEVRGYLSVTRSLTVLAFAFLWVCIAALLLIILDVAYQRAHERRADMVLERILGASTAQVVIPFATEIIVLLLGALLVGTLCAAGITVSVPFLLPGFEPGGIYAEARTYILPILLFFLPVIIAIEAALAVLLGLLDGYVAARSRFTPRASY